MDDQTDLSAIDESSSSSTSSFGLTLDDLANSAVSTIGGAAVKGIGNVVSQSLTPSPDLAAKAATPQSTSHIAVGSVALPILLVGGAVVAYMLLKR